MTDTLKLASGIFIFLLNLDILKVQGIIINLD